MSLVVNNNLMAANVARNLNAHYGRLNTSTQRLSSGLRVNSAADDAAGLAIRELQRADIAALHQGARNANDAISMIQVADGSLGIIDEKLIRMKELAEQAATGTYDSTQRLMIESEYQAMASEITRIANATDFNGTKLLDGTLAGDHDGSGMISEGKMKIHFGTGNDSAEDYYYVEIGECTSEAFGLGNNSTWQDVQRRGTDALKDSLRKQIKADKTLDQEEKGKLLASIDEMAATVNKAITDASDYKQAYKLWGEPGTDDEGFLKAGKKWIGNSTLMDEYLAAAAKAEKAPAGDPAKIMAAIEKGVNDAIAANNKLPAGTTSIDNKDDFVTQILTNLNGAGGADPNYLKTALTDAGIELDDGIRQNLADAVKAAITNSNATANAFTIGAAADTAAGADTNKIEDDAELTAAINALTPELSKLLAADTALQAAATNAAVEAAGDQILANITSAVDSAFKLYAPDFAANPPVNPAPEMTADEFNIFTANISNAAVKAARESGFDEAAIAKLQNIIGAAVPKNPQTGGAGDPYLVADVSQFITDSKAAIEGLTAEAQAAAKANSQGNALDKFWNGLRETEKQKLQYAWGQAAIYNLANAKPDTVPPTYGLEAGPIDFGQIAGFVDDPANNNDPYDIAKGMLNQALKDMRQKVGHMDFAGHTVETQEDAQMALNAINDAIVSKDKIRAHLGAAQNRLENTVTNLNIQAENLQAAESRISDVDVATEMTQFVRNQILTQSAVAMLSQANSLPQMAMQLIGG